MTYKPTAAPKAKTDAKRAHFHELVDQLAEMTVEQRQALALGLTTVEGHLLSLHNACLVALQLPTATMVGGFRQWIAAGRCVKKGETGLSIWIPKSEKEPEPGAGPRPGEISTKSPGFFCGTVFDISQTEPLAPTTGQKAG